MNPEELYATNGTDVASNDTHNIEEDVVEKTPELADESTSEENHASMDDINSLVDFVNVESAKSELDFSTKVLTARQDQVSKLIAGGEETRDFLLDKLNTMTLDECETYLKSDKNVLDFFKNSETGDEICVDVKFETKEKEIEFKRDLLVYLKSSQETLAKIDEEYDKLDAATKELNMNIEQVCKQLSDNTLGYIQHMKDKAETVKDESEKKAMLEVIRYIESGYTLEVFKDVLVKHPSVCEKCVKELTNELDASRIGQRYNKHLERQNIRASLIPFISDMDNQVRSFEEMVLIEGDQYTVPDLFVYSLIRYFAMADWNNQNIRKAHASIILVIKRMLANDFDERVKADIIANVTEYLKMFKVC